MMSESEQSDPGDACEGDRSAGDVSSKQQVHGHIRKRDQA
jgi:hypothetical protein